jgi:hypothetical protein
MAEDQREGQANTNPQGAVGLQGVVPVTATPKTAQARARQARDILEESNAWQAMTQGLSGLEYHGDSITADATVNPDLRNRLGHAAATILGYYGFVVDYSAVPTLAVRFRLPGEGE